MLKRQKVQHILLSYRTDREARKRHLGKVPGELISGQMHLLEHSAGKYILKRIKQIIRHSPVEFGFTMVGLGVADEASREGDSVILAPDNLRMDKLAAMKGPTISSND
jgi:hypothetical protein